MKSTLKKIILKNVDSCLISGTGRCGTTYIAGKVNQILSRKIAYHEPHPRFIGIQNETKNSQIQSIIRGRGTIALANKIRNHSQPIQFIESNGHLSFAIESYNQVWKSVKNIIVIRDYKSCITSLASMDFGKGPYLFSEFDHQAERRPNPSKLGFITSEIWAESSRLVKIAYYWSCVNHHLISFAASNPENCIVLKFEELKENELDFFRAISLFLEIPFPLEEFVADNKVRRNSSKEINQKRVQWNDIESSIKDEIQRICSPIQDRTENLCFKIT